MQRNATEDRLSRERREQAIVDFTTNLKGIQREVFASLAKASFTAKNEVDWKALASECWPKKAGQTISDTVTRQHVDDAVNQVKKKAAEWSAGKLVMIEVINVLQAGREAKKWKVLFRVSPKDRVNEKRPAFMWSFVTKRGGNSASTKSDVRDLAVWVPLFDKDSIQFNIIPKGRWSHPATFPNYKSHRDQVWRSYEEARAKEGLSRPLITQHWHVAKCACDRSSARGYPEANLYVSRLDFADFQATTERLQDVIDVNGERMTVEALFRKDWQPDDHEHFPPAANLLSVDVNIITRDRKLVVRRERKDGPWETAVFGYVDALEDVNRHDTHIPTPRETVFRKCCQLLGLTIRPAFIRWMGIGLGTKKGNVSLFGEIKIGPTFEQLERLFEARPDKEKSYQIAGIDLNRENAPSALCEVLEKDRNRHRRHAEVALVLSVARRHHNVKIEAKPV